MNMLNKIYKYYYEVEIYEYYYKDLPIEMRLGTKDPQLLGTYLGIKRWVEWTWEVDT